MYLVLSAREYRWKHYGDIHILSINCVDIMLIEHPSLQIGPTSTAVNKQMNL